MREHPRHQLPAAVLPPVVTVVEVMARYGFRDRRAARRLMHAVGAFRVGGRILVRAEDLVAYEDRLIAARPQPPPQPYVRSHRAVGAQGRVTRGAPLRPGWWREGAQP